MKNLKIYLVLLAISTLIILSSCTKKISCNELEAKISDAATAFGLNQTQQTCQEYYDAIQDYYDGCASVPASVRATYDAWLNSIDCSIY